MSDLHVLVKTLNATVRKGARRLMLQTQSIFRSSLDMNLHVGSNNASLMPSLVLGLKKLTAAEASAIRTSGFKDVCEASNRARPQALTQ